MSLHRPVVHKNMHDQEFGTRNFETSAKKCARHKRAHFLKMLCFCWFSLILKFWAYSCMLVRVWHAYS